MGDADRFAFQLILSLGGSNPHLIPEIIQNLVRVKPSGRKIPVAAGLGLSGAKSFSPMAVAAARVARAMRACLA